MKPHLVRQGNYWRVYRTKQGYYNNAGYVASYPTLKEAWLRYEEYK